MTTNLWVLRRALAVLFLGATFSGNADNASLTSSLTSVNTINHGDSFCVKATPGGVAVCCGFQRLEGQATPQGLWLRSTADNSSGESFRVLSTSIGRSINFGEICQSGPVSTPLSGDVSVANDAVKFIRSGLTEEYSVSVDGVRQDFIIEQRPAGEGDLRLELNVTGATAAPVKSSVELVLNDCGRKLAYHRLTVTDALGKELSARFEVADEQHISVVVNDEKAVYPVRIDPTFSDADWTSISGVPGADGTVNAAVFDASGNLYIGGSCNVVGDIVAKQIAMWNGTTWVSLGGINGTVSALAISGNDLYVGGLFDRVGLNIDGGIAATNLAKWNGSTWSAVGGGVNGTVTSLAVSGTDLYVGGSFSFAGDVFALRVAKWDGNSWSALGSGLNNTVNALAVVGTDLYAGGSFTQSGSTSVLRIAKWNGATWSAVGTGMSGAVNAFAVSGTDLIAAGAFTIPASYIAKWNGSTWSAFGSGLGTNANAVVVSGSDVYVGGSFITPATRIAKWDGNAWSAVASGMNSTVNTLATFGSTVVAGGSFTSPAMRIAAWSGTNWSSLGTGLNGPVNAVAISGNDVYLGGSFKFIGVSGSANIIRWDGATWSPLGGGLSSSVSALAVSGGNLYAGGAFTSALNTGDVLVTVNRVAKWDGTSWSALDAGMNGTVNALTFSGSDLYAGGAFTTPAARIAKWNGASWSTVGEGFNNTVSALTMFGSDIIAGGSFTSATNSGAISVSTARIARWNGAAWSALGSGCDSTVNALAANGSTLYAGGFFNNAGGVAVGRIAQWNGSAWSVLGSATNNIFVTALAVSDTNLYVGGTFTQIGSTAANNIAKWDGNDWTALGSGVGNVSIPSVNALAITGGKLYVGGNFMKAGGKAAGFVSKVIIGTVIDPGQFTSVTYSPVSGFSCVFSNATIGQSYRVQGSPSLSPTNWTDLTNFTYTGPTVITNGLNGLTTNRFFRAVAP